MFKKNVFLLTEKILKGYSIDYSEAEKLSLINENAVFDLFYCANLLRTHFKGNSIKFCSIVNAKSGLCSEDCKFCAQSSRYSTNIKKYPLIKKQQIIQTAKKAEKAGAQGFSIVTSGLKISHSKEWTTILNVIKDIKNNLYLCASLGELTEKNAINLKNAGLLRYHHNLETSQNFFKQVCTTHSYADKIKTIKIAKNAGLEVCSGGIFGIGETWDDRLKLAFTLKELKINSIPLNFLNPIPNTPLETQKLLAPLEILKIIAIYRFIMPDKDISVCGGREINLRDLQSWIFYAGANGTMIGNYLTTKGRSFKKDLQMLQDLGLEKYNKE